MDPVKTIAIIFMMAVLVFILLSALGVTEDISDWWTAKKDKKIEIESVSKLVPVKMLSDNVKDIEEFIYKNVALLSKEQIAGLVARMDGIKTDTFLLSEENKRFKLHAIEAEQSEPLAANGGKKKR